MVTVLAGVAVVLAVIGCATAAVLTGALEGETYAALLSAALTGGVAGAGVAIHKATKPG